ncbi:MAG: hypothetical protein ABI467_03315 [Kofleriaceae bacterium]
MVDEDSFNGIRRLLAPIVSYENLHFDDPFCAAQVGERGTTRDNSRTLAGCLGKITRVRQTSWVGSPAYDPPIAPTFPPVIQIWIDDDRRVVRIAMRGEPLGPKPVAAPTETTSPPPAKPPTEIMVDAPVFGQDEKANLRDDTALATTQRLKDAIGAKQPAAIEATLDARLRFEGLVFTDPACTKRFGAKGTLVRKDLTSFAKCVLTVDGIHDLAFVSSVDGADSTRIDPSYRSFRGRLEIWVSPRQPTAIVRILATIMPAEPNENENGIEGPDPGDPQGSKEVRADEVTRLLRHGSLEVVGKVDVKGRRAEVYLCFDERGALYLFSIIRRSGMAEWDARVREQIRELAITPYTSDGKAVRVCTSLLFTAKVP